MNIFKQTLFLSKLGKESQFEVVSLLLTYSGLDRPCRVEGHKICTFQNLKWIQLVRIVQSPVTGPVLPDSQATTQNQWRRISEEQRPTSASASVRPGSAITRVYRLYMALYQDDSQEDAQECPVCYESQSGSERTLSCGHVFCHDCLVKTLFSINRDGLIRDTIICPICRHLTFIRRQNDALVSLSESKHPDDGQTLQVPLAPSPPQLQGARRASAAGFLSGVHRVALCCGRKCRRLGREKLIGHDNNNACQIFIISAQGRPMAEEDALDVVMTVIHPQRRERRRICTTARCLLCLLMVFTVLALAAATLPWILLA